jgi:hypothetical protein
LPGEALNGLGRYTVSIPEQNATLTAITAAYGVLTVGGTVVAGFGAGQLIAGAGVAANTSITEQLTGTPGGAGTYVVNNATPVAGPVAITSQSAIETKYFAKTVGAPGEIVKISPRQ